MSLRILETVDERLVGREVLRELRAALSGSGSAVLLVPSFAQALDAQRALSGEGGLSMGVSVTTPSAWAEGRWGVWGDGRRVVEGAARGALCDRVIAASPDAALRPSAGLSALLGDLARAGLPWLRGAAAPDGVTEAESSLVGLLDDYARRLSELGLVEGCEVMAELPGVLEAAGARVPPVVWAGFGSLRRAERELMCGLARTHEVSLVVAAGEGPAHAQARSLAAGLESLAGARGVLVGHQAPAGPDEAAPARSRELSAVLDALFVAGTGPVAPTGSVRLLLPAGPSAEPEAVAREVVGLAARGAREVVVAAPDAAAAWRELAPRLAARGLSARAELSVPFASLGAGRAFLEYATTVARLAELAASWPPSLPVPDAPSAGTVRVSLGDMTWWPPRELSDFLSCEVSGLTPDAASSLDAEWRANRLLAPADVLDQLCTVRATSAACAAATRELLRGRIGSAASKLLAPYVRGELVGSPGAPEVTAALSVVLDVARTLGDLGLSASPDVPGHLSLVELVGVARDVLGRTRVTLRPALGCPGAPCLVRVMAPLSASRLEPASVDALVLLGQTSAESDVSSPDDVCGALLELYGVEARPSAMDAARSQFLALARVPRSALVAERLLFGPDGKERYPSVMLTELLACYGLGADDRPAAIAATLGPDAVVSRSEVRVGENASASGEEPRVAVSETPAPAGRIDASERALVSPPPEGTAGGSGPLLSASQIETYLECPYKWFSLRRLRLRDADASFGSAEKGTFVHRVLEVTRRELLARAAERAWGGHDLADLRAAAPAAMQDARYRELVGRIAERAAASPETRLPGSALDAPGALEEARSVLDEEFEAHLAHQFQLVRGRPAPQALVAHSAREEGQVQTMRRDLDTLLDFESGAFEGFEPRLMEWRFGRREREVSYAGARLVGTVDRVDVDAHGQAVVIDYKHKAKAGFADEYDVFGASGVEPGGFAAPRRVQSLIYAQVVRRAFPGLRVRAAVYLSTRGSQHVIAGAVDEELVGRVLGASGARRPKRLAVPRAESFGVEGESGMEALLDACEELVGSAISRMLGGDIEARPASASACDYCPVLNCERRLRK